MSYNRAPTIKDMTTLEQIGQLACNGYHQSGDECLLAIRIMVTKQLGIRFHPQSRGLTGIKHMALNQAVAMPNGPFKVKR
jgi:hypothetical protein